MTRRTKTGKEYSSSLECSITKLHFKYQQFVMEKYLLTI